MPPRRVGCPMRVRTGPGQASQQEWVVLLEAIPGRRAGAAPMDVETARTLLRAVGGGDGVALQCPDRVAVQLPITALDAATALATAYRRWRTATRIAGAEGWDVVRAEVMTNQEFQREIGGKSS
jgi:hypothetical protein